MFLTGMKTSMNFDEIDRRTEICLECPNFILKDARCRQSGEFLVKYIYTTCPENRWSNGVEGSNLPEVQEGNRS